MKHFKTLASHMAAYSLLAVVITSCSSDPNPVGYIRLDGEPAYVSLDLSVAATRAGEADAAAAETAVSTVSIYIFGDDNTLEKIQTGLTVTDNKIDKIETTSGMKTIYAVAGGSVTGVKEKETSLDDFESTKLTLSINDMAKMSGFMMIGKSDKKRVMKSSSEDAMPASNNFPINLTRLAAKAQVIQGADLAKNSAGIGFDALLYQFGVRQIANNMLVKPNTADFQTFNDDDNDGTFDCYTKLPSNNEFITKPASFGTGKFAYMSENIVSKPVSGNTTYVCVKMTMTPKKRYTFPTGASKPTVFTPTEVSISFYTVGIIDRKNGFADYVVDDENNVMCFNNNEEATNYANALNDGNASAMTVSDTDHTMKVLSSTRADNPQYEVATFLDADAYYRINIANTDGAHKIDRNTFYKITINSVKTLGFPDEDMLRPTNPNTPLDFAPNYWLDASFTVQPWSNVDQSVDL